MDAEQLALPDAGFDLALCALGLMYLPDPAAALRELHRVLRPGGRAVLAVWGERARCGWAPLFGIVDAEVRSEVCPLFFGLGQDEALATLLRIGRPAGDRAAAAQRLAGLRRRRRGLRRGIRRRAGRAGLVALRHDGARSACRRATSRRLRRGVTAWVIACRLNT